MNHARRSLLRTLEGASPRYPRNMAEAARALRDAGSTPGITVDPLLSHGDGGAWTVQSAGDAGIISVALSSRKEDYHYIREYPWLLLSKTTVLTFVVTCFEILLLLAVGSETGRLLREMVPMWGLLYLVCLLALFLYGIAQVLEIKDKPHWSDTE